MRYAPLQAAIALVFLLMTSFQPGLFAMASTTGIERIHVAAADDHAAHDHAHAPAQHAGDDANGVHGHAVKHHHGSGKIADKSCEVSCAPAAAVLVDCPAINVATSHCYAAEVVSTGAPGEAVGLIRPPRS